MILFSDSVVAVYLISLTVLAGLFLGSALHCLAWRVAHNEKWSSGRSHCPSCNHVLAVKDLIPVFSWLSLSGKCRYCKQKISARYPASETVLAILFILVLLRFDATVATLLYFILTSCLFILSIVDLEIMEIPDRFVLIPAVALVLYQLVFSGVKGAWTAIWHGLLIGAVLLGFVLLMDKILKKESMGGGDIKLIAMLGMYLSFPGVLLMLIVSCVIGLIFAFIGNAKDKAFPFGPSIALAAFFVLLYGDPIINWYLGLF